MKLSLYTVFINCTSVFDPNSGRK